MIKIKEINKQFYFIFLCYDYLDDHLFQSNDKTIIVQFWQYVYSTFSGKNQYNYASVIKENIWVIYLTWLIILPIVTIAAPGGY